MYVPDSRGEDVGRQDFLAEHAEVVPMGRTDVLQVAITDCGNERVEVLACQGETHRRRRVELSDDGLKQLVTK